jgi:predicted metal-binding membrane protein
MTGSTDRIARRAPASSAQRALAGSLVALGAAAWLYTAREAGSMNCAMTMPAMHGPWWVACALYMAAWVTMMAAMMLPAVTPMVLLFGRIARTRNARTAVPASWLFVFGYILVWSVLGIPVYFATLAVPKLLSATTPAAVYVVPLVLFTAGLYQISPLKNACLRHCTAPLEFVLDYWRDGIAGAWLMGIHHGAVCVACCAALMAVLFSLGVMNLTWMIVIASCMLAERLVPRGWIVSWSTGLLLMIAGLIALFLPGLSEALQHF